MSDLDEARVNRIAEVSYEAIRAYSYTLGEPLRAPWDHASEHRREATRRGVRGILLGHLRDARAAHDAWLSEHRAEGWNWGPIIDEHTRRHPALLPYEQLPQVQRTKGELCRAVVLAMDRVLRAIDDAREIEVQP